MGLEAEGHIETGGETHRVKAVLESRELILRGDFRKTFAVSDLSQVAVRGNALDFRHGAADYILHLPEGRAETWAKKITTPPPSLASKLGISPDKRAFVIGEVTDKALAAALDGCTVETVADAAQVVIIGETPDSLPDADALPGLPVWIVYPKGAGSPLPETTVRAHMRAGGWSDTKTSAVSERLTAFRFHRR